MGVLRLFRHFINAYKNFYRTYPKLPGKSQFFDYVLLDLNAIFHPACRDIFFPAFKSLLHRHARIDPEEGERRAFQRITEMIEDIIKVTKPRRVLYLAIDGVAGMCKQAQQRKRRFRAAQLRDPNAPFDTANITAGTPWMARLCKHLADWIQEKKPTLFSKIQVVYSDMYVPGEGEHKLIRYLNNQKQTNFTYCIYSPDADLIMLCMCQPKGQGFILRENIYDDVQGHWIIVDCDKLKEQVYEQITWGDNMFDANQVRAHSSRVIKDFVLFLMLIGNDFLPSLYCLEIINEGMNVLAQSYTDAAQTHGYLVNEVNDINLKTFTKLFENLSSHESSLMLRKFHRGSKFADNLLSQNILRQPNKNGVFHESIDFDNLRKQYYTKKFPEFEWTDEKFQSNVDEVCKAYIHGLSFVIKYYSVAIPTFEWYYEYHYAPFMTDLFRFASQSDLKQWNELQEWLFQPPLTLNQALLGIMPPSSASTLPASLQPLLQRNADHPLFKEEFEVDLEGKQQDYEAVLLLPIVDYQTLKMLCKDTSAVGQVLNF